MIRVDTYMKLLSVNLQERQRGMGLRMIPSVALVLHLSLKALGDRGVMQGAATLSYQGEELADFMLAYSPSQRNWWIMRIDPSEKVAYWLGELVLRTLRGMVDQQTPDDLISLPWTLETASE